MALVLGAILLLALAVFRGDAETRRELGAEIADVRQELGAQIADVRQELGAQIDTRFDALLERLAESNAPGALPPPVRSAR